MSKPLLTVTLACALAVLATPAVARAELVVGAADNRPASSPDQAERSQVVRAAGAAFRRAIVLDPANDDAKFNLESILRLVADERNRGQGGGGSSGQEGTEFGGAALSRRGSGY